MAEEWKRVMKGGWKSTATERAVDEDAIQTLLHTRLEAKKRKNYKEADKCAAKLQAQGIAYIDEKREWYTKAHTDKPKEAAEQTTTDKADGKKRKCNDSSRETVSTDGGEDESSDDENDSEEEQEDDAFVSKMRFAIVKEALDRKRARVATSASGLPLSSEKKESQKKKDRMVGKEKAKKGEQKKTKNKKNKKKSI